MESRQRQIIFLVLRIDSFGFEQLLLALSQVVPDERNIASLCVIIRRRPTWHRHGIKCSARADGITESNGAARPGKNISFSVLAQLRHPPPKLDRAAQTCALGRTRDYSHGIRIFRT